ncbi:MAG: hypothetical protein A2W86_03860 [Bacteroidetes bacterium GWD2_45_23]|uniref:Uncharacterized protein n=1 Tax=bioreactor metagenome TaxID=1076179 RepID=A0A645E412_9ZZZZ|nr:MAG: hypothetical protein A2W87_14175 [Bacteroidetes bacterium GWC2_46_850]OFX74903.1 MAG: hypothetical protein A2071_08560 [Bacteroidetes bacterium GWC1_47_7]OFX86232.1 MAG: hypothetical protein A2W86_03860 [Bacteroidetes bacterium GWD2_45_23]HAR37938.1 hypothetical protein [Porphyromonadaceae bacterium]HCC17369.1 hypothetical protein [Porphyromonadaceae bacterium]
MEFGDIIYLILLVFFMILGFFNDSRKKKNKQMQSEKPSNPYSEMPQRRSETPRRPFLETSETEEEEEEELPKTRVRPPASPVLRKEPERTTFRSSMELTTDFAKESSLKSSIFVYDADASYYKNPETLDIGEASDDMSQATIDGKKSGSLHPLLAELYGDSGREELLKGLIIGDVIRRKY